MRQGLGLILLPSYVHFTVNHAIRAVGAVSQSLVVGHDDQGLLKLVSQTDQQLHDVVRVAAIQISRGLIRKKDHGVVNEGPRNGDSLLLPAR